MNLIVDAVSSPSYKRYGRFTTINVVAVDPTRFVGETASSAEEEAVLQDLPLIMATRDRILAWTSSPYLFASLLYRDGRCAFTGSDTNFIAPINKRQGHDLIAVKIPSGALLPGWKETSYSPEHYSQPPVAARFVPSRDTIQDYVRARRQSLTDWLEGSTINAERVSDKQLEQVGEELTVRVAQVFATIACRAAALERRRVRISDSKGRFSDLAEELLTAQLRLRPTETGQFLPELSRDLSVFASHNRLVAEWGSLGIGPAGLYVDVGLDTSPRPATRAKARVVFR